MRFARDVRGCGRLALLSLVLLLPLVLSAHAANWYVRPTAQGSNTGVDWNNAWSLTAINWGSVKPGDTVWLAGGLYSSLLTIGANGIANSRIFIMRPTAADSAPTSAAGWQGSFAGTVSVLGIRIPGNNFITIDGRTQYGIVANMTNSNGGAVGMDIFRSASSNNLQILNVEVLGGYLTPAENTAGQEVNC